MKRKVNFELTSFSVAVFLVALVMGAIGMLVVVPIACIEWGWNAVADAVSFIPAINAWQAALLYMAFALTMHLTGIFRVEIRANR